MSLKVTTEPRDNRQLAVTIEVPQERVDKELHKAAAKVAAEYRLPGFRKGKAPYNIVVQQFGLGNLYSEFVDDLGNEVFREAVEQENLTPYAMASLEDIQMDPLTYRLIVPLEPTVELGDYRALRIEADTAEVTEEQVDERIEQLREQYSSWRAVERPSVYGDMMTIDVKSVIPATDSAEAGAEEIVVLDETDWDVTPDEENPMDPPGFDAELLALTPGTTKEFSLSWPAESQSIYAGKTANFTVTVKGIQAYDKPDLDDDFPALVGPDYTSLEDLRASIRDTLERTEDSRAEDTFLSKALDGVVEVSTLDYPPVLIEDQIDSMLQEFERRLRMFGIENLDAYFSQVGQDKNEYRESLREDATLQAKRNLVLSEIVKVEKLDASDEEINAHIHAMVGNASVTDGNEQAEAMHNMLHTPTGVSLITNDILRSKAVRALLAIVKGEEVAAPGEHPPLMPEEVPHDHDHEEDEELGDDDDDESDEESSSDDESSSEDDESSSDEEESEDEESGDAADDDAADDDAADEEEESGEVAADDDAESADTK